jgi:hypothetical protein
MNPLKMSRARSILAQRRLRRNQIVASEKLPRETGLRGWEIMSIVDKSRLATARRAVLSFDFSPKHRPPGGR